MTVLSDLRTGTRLHTRRAAGWMLCLLGDEVARLNYRPWRDDPYPLYARLRDRPLYRSHTGMWAATTYHVCNDVLRDRRLGVQFTDGRVGGAEALGFPPEFQPQPSFLELDPPDHTRLRAHARSAFLPRRIARYRGRIEQVAHRLLDSALAKDEFDMIADFAALLPILVISELLGVPDRDTDRFAHYGRTVGAALAGVGSLRQALEIQQATTEVDALFTELITARTVDPRDDITSELARDAGDAGLAADELMATCELLFIAGFETTMHLIGNGMAAMLASPDQWELLRRQHDLASAAVEETLRYDPPVQLVQRITHQRLDLHGIYLEPDTVILLLLGSTGRDPDVHAMPDRFDITRDPSPEHLAFSAGSHYCLGAPLARLEADVAYRALAERAPLLHRTAGAERLRSPIIRGFRHLPVSVKGSRQTRPSAGKSRDLTAQTRHRPEPLRPATTQWAPDSRTSAPEPA